MQSLHERPRVAPDQRIGPRIIRLDECPVGKKNQVVAIGIRKQVGHPDIQFLKPHFFAHVEPLEHAMLRVEPVNAPTADTRYEDNVYGMQPARRMRGPARAAGRSTALKAGIGRKRNEVDNLSQWRPPDRATRSPRRDNLGKWAGLRWDKIRKTNSACDRPFERLKGELHGPRLGLERCFHVRRFLVKQLSTLRHRWPPWSYSAFGIRRIRRMRNRTSGTSATKQEYSSARWRP